MANTTEDVGGNGSIRMTVGADQELCRSFKTIVEMLRDRGNASARLEQMTADDLITASSGRLIFYVDDADIGHRIIYDMSAKFTPQNIKKILESLPEDIKTVIIVVRKWASNNSTTFTSMDKYFRELGIKAQFFELRRLQFNPTHHFLVPKHEPIRDEETITQLLSKYMLKSRFQLPIIYDKDPIAQYLDLQHGQLVKITRTSPTAGVHELYRCCCTKVEK